MKRSLRAAVPAFFIFSVFLSRLFPAQASPEIDRVALSDALYSVCKTFVLETPDMYAGLFGLGNTPDNFCRCVGDLTSAGATRADALYLMQNGKQSPSFLNLYRDAHEVCLSQGLD